MLLFPSTRATAVVDPTWQCVVDKGHPKCEPHITTIVEPISIHRPLLGVIFANFIPIASMILYPYIAIPREIPTPPIANIQYASSPRSFVFWTPFSLYIMYTAAKGPMLFATSFEPCANASNAAVHICKGVNAFSVLTANPVSYTHLTLPTTDWV